MNNILICYFSTLGCASFFDTFKINGIIRKIEMGSLSLISLISLNYLVKLNQIPVKFSFSSITYCLTALIFHRKIKEIDYKVTNNINRKIVSYKSRKFARLMKKYLIKDINDYIMKEFVDDFYFYQFIDYI